VEATPEQRAKLKAYLESDKFKRLQERYEQSTGKKYNPRKR